MYAVGHGSSEVTRFIFAQKISASVDVFCQLQIVKLGQHVGDQR